MNIREFAGVEVVSVGYNTHVANLAAHVTCYVSDEQVGQRAALSVLGCYVDSL